MRAVIVSLFLVLAVPTEAFAVDLRSGLCTPLEVSELTNRVHVQCTSPVAGTSIVYFAEDTSERERANRLLGMFLIAQALGSDLFVRFDLDDQSAASFGCLANDCRRPDWVSVQGAPQAALPSIAAALRAGQAILVPEPTPGGSASVAIAGLVGLGLRSRRSGRARAGHDRARRRRNPARRDRAAQPRDDRPRAP